MKRVAVVQSNYIPWKGYFDMIGMVDEFILYDDAQYTRRDWRNRNRIKTPKGTRWLSIPVTTRGRFSQRIDETKISDPEWGRRHWDTILHEYAAAPHFKAFKKRFEELYLGEKEDSLSRVNFRFLIALCGMLGIKTKITWSTDYSCSGEKTEKLVQLCKKAGATEYLSGPAAKDYLDEKKFLDLGINVRWMDYSGYPEYGQLHPPFVHEVSVVDLILNEGPNAARFMKSFHHGAAL